MRQNIFLGDGPFGSRMAAIRPTLGKQYVRAIPVARWTYSPTPNVTTTRPTSQPMATQKSGVKVENPELLS